MKQQITIPKNKKTKVVGLFVIVALAVLTLWAISQFLLPVLPGLLKFKTVVLASLAAAFVFAIFLILTQILSKKPAIIISAEGITDYSSPSGVGLIPWSEIEGVKEATNSMKQKLAVIELKTPQNYVHVKGAKFSNVRQSYLKQFGSPVVISMVNLKEHKDDFIQIVEGYIVKA